MKTARVSAILLALALCSTGWVFAQNAGNQDVHLSVSPRLWGLDFGIGASKWHLVPNLNTTLSVLAGGAWDNKGYFRNPDGSPYTGTLLDPANSPYYDRLNLMWRMGVTQGIIGNPALPQDLLSGFLFAQAGFSRPLDASTTTQLLFYPDTPGSTPVHSQSGDDAHVSLLVGLQANTLSQNDTTNTTSGYLLEGSLEAAPGWLVNFATANVDYWRTNVTAKYFLPIYALDPVAGKNRFSLYLAERFEADYIWGSSIPLSAVQQLGGTNPVDGLGDAVRGLEKNRYSANLKIVNNLELRANLPALVYPAIIPTVLAFLDAGYYNGLPGAPAGSTTSGYAVSTGLGVSLHVTGLGDLAAYTEYLLHGTLVTGGAWTPLALSLGLQF